MKTIVKAEIFAVCNTNVAQNLLSLWNVFADVTVYFQPCQKVHWIYCPAPIPHPRYIFKE